MNYRNLKIKELPPKGGRFFAGRDSDHVSLYAFYKGSLDLPVNGEDCASHPVPTGIFNIFLTLLLFLPLLRCSESRAASCCGRNAATPTLIVGDDRAQMNFTLSGSGFVANASSDGVAKFEGGDSKFAYTYRWDGAILLEDRLQAGLSFSVVNQSFNQGSVQETYTGVGDIKLSLGYEVLPLWSYSSWKPQGFAFAMFNIPTGRSTLDSETLLATDVIGSGYYSLSTGFLLLKKWKIWDVFLLPEFHYSLPREVSAGSFNFVQRPGVGGSLGLGVGLSPGGGVFRLGMRLQQRYDQGILSVETSQSTEQSGPSRSSCDFGLDLAYLFQPNATMMVSYIDQTLIGSAKNAPLNRTVALNFQYRWPR